STRKWPSRSPSAICVRRPICLSAFSPRMRASRLISRADPCGARSFCSWILRTMSSVTFHHIIADGWSLDVFLRELAALYTAFRKGAPSPLLPLRSHYGDFAAWQDRHLRLESQLAFWKRELSGLGRCDMPTDHRRPALPSYRGARVPISLDAALVRQLRALSHAKEATLFMTLLAAWQALLHRSGAGDDVAVGTPIAGRQHEE